VIVLLTIVFYVWGQREKRNQDILAGDKVRDVGSVPGD
jgi:hypothetical protein